MAGGIALAVVGAGWVVGWLLFARAPALRTVAIAEPRAAVDVVIAARDEQARLPRLLAALSRQSYLAQRVIVVDEGSADGTAALAPPAHATVPRARRPRATPRPVGPDAEAPPRHRARSSCSSTPAPNRS